MVFNTEFAFELILFCLNILALITFIRKGDPVPIVHCFNIAYFAYIIEYYNDPIVISFLNNVALVIIILNSLALCGYYIRSHGVRNEDKITTRGGGGGSWRLSQV